VTVAAAASARASRTRLRSLLGEHPVGYLFVAPFVRFLVGIYAYPFFCAIYMSFFAYVFSAPGAEVVRPFVGLGNYARVLQDPLFHIAIRNVVIFLVINVPLTVAISMVLATALNAAIALHEAGILEKYDCPLIGASVEAIQLGEDRQLFKGVVQRCGGETARSRIAHTMDECLSAAAELGYPALALTGAARGAPGRARRKRRRLPLGDGSPQRHREVVTVPQNAGPRTLIRSGRSGPADDHTRIVRRSPGSRST